MPPKFDPNEIKVGTWRAAGREAGGGRGARRARLTRRCPRSLPALHRRRGRSHVRAGPQDRTPGAGTYRGRGHGGGGRGSEGREGPSTCRTPWEACPAGGTRESQGEFRRGRGGRDDARSAGAGEQLPVLLRPGALRAAVPHSEGHPGHFGALGFNPSPCDFHVSSLSPPRRWAMTSPRPRATGRGCGSR